MGIDPSFAFLYALELCEAADAARKKSAQMGAVREERGTGAGPCPG